jgi:microcystin-dependent protein
MSASSPFGAGSVSMYAGDLSDPAKLKALIAAGWLPCDGASYVQTAYPDLYAAIGAANGGSDTSFNVPDLRSKLPRGVNGTANAVDPDAATRTAAASGGNTGNAVGSIQTDATAMPVNAFTVAPDGLHQHTFTNLENDDKEAWDGNTHRMARNPWAEESTSTDGLHSHTFTGGDPMTMPVNMALYYIIKATAS